MAFLSTALITIDLTLAGLFWALGQNNDVMVKFLRKILYVGFFAFIITNFSFLANVIFDSFSRLGITATGSTISAADIGRPGFVAATGFEAAFPLLEEIKDLTGPVAFFVNIVIISILGLAWVITLFSFFFLAIQLFVTILEFKLTTLAGFVLIPFALWNKTSFLAEKVMGNVIASGIKVMVLSIIIGIRSTLFADITATFTPGEVTLQQASSVILGSLAMLMLGIFGPGIATGLVSGAPQLGAGAAIGTAAGAAAGAVGGASIAKSGVGAGVNAAKSSAGAAASLAGGASTAFSLRSAASGQGGIKGAAAGAAGVAKAGAGAVKGAAGRALGKAKNSLAQKAQSGARSAFTNTGGKGAASSSPSAASENGQPDWARKIRSGQARRDAGLAAATLARDGDSGGGAEAPRLKDSEE